MRFTRVLFMLIVFLLIGAVAAFAGVMEVVKTITSAESFIVGVVTVVLLFVMKWVPNDKIQAAIGGLGELCGRAMTLNLAKWKWSAPYWNTIIEPYIIDLVDNTVVTFVNAWKDAMRSDNA